MTLDKKKKAALAAVAACIKQGPMEVQPGAVTPPPLPGPNLWGQSGRLSGMEFRNLMQMKGLHRK